MSDTAPQPEYRCQVCFDQKLIIRDSGKKVRVAGKWERLLVRVRCPECRKEKTDG